MLNKLFTVKSQAFPKESVRYYEPFVVGTKQQRSARASFPMGMGLIKKGYGVDPLSECCRKAAIFPDLSKEVIKSLAII